MGLGKFEPDVWIPLAHPAARPVNDVHAGQLVEADRPLARRLEPGIYDAWTGVIRAIDPRFEFADPPLRHSLPMDLAFAATADRPTAVLTGPGAITGSPPRLIRLPRPMVAHDMVRVGLKHRPLTATAVLVWNRDLPRSLQQILFDAADSMTPSAAARVGGQEPAAVGL
jgi:hypothetical protein